uniref:Conoporin 4 n=1 Tax=Conus geographus TaxID=6491 RepID=W4VRW5_CONGE
MGVPFPALKTMVTVYLLLMGNTSPVVLGSSTTLSAVRAIAATVVTSGSSLKDGLLKDLADNSYWVTCAIQVENWTRFALKAPRLMLKSGADTKAPVFIEPGKREAFAVRKTAYTATGVSGTVSWEVDWYRQRFVIMWSTPFDFNIHSNWMGMGMTREGLVDVAPNNVWFNQMYKYGNNDDLTFERKEFYKNMDTFVYSNEKFEAEGYMTNSRHALVRVIFRPANNKWEYLANEIERELTKSSPAPDN